MIAYFQAVENLRKHSRHLRDETKIDKKKPLGKFSYSYLGFSYFLDKEK